MAILSIILGKDILESRSFPDGHLSISGYFEGLRKDMIEEHEEIIQIRKDVPSFELQMGNPEKYA